MNAPSLSVVLAGGGTAGHINPLLAIASALTERCPDAAVLVVGTSTGMETRLVPAAGYQLATIDRVPMPRSLSMDLLKLPIRFLGAVRQALGLLGQARPDVVVGVGGYVCTPVYLAAALRRIPLVVHEANARPGLANRVGARLARRVGVAFANTRLPHAEWVGMPMRTEISTLDRRAAQPGARQSLGLEPDLPTVVVTGGSSGAARINSAIAETREDFAGAGIQVLHVTGRSKAVLDTRGTPVRGSHYHQVEYVDGMETAYAAADILVARAGAGTVSEVSAVGLPSVLVPLPHGNGEQALNAAALTHAGGALLVADKDFTASWIRDHLIPLCTDQKQLRSMSAAASSLGTRDAAAQMAGIILAEAGARNA